MAATISVVVKAALKNSGHYYDFNTNTLHLSKKFMDKAKRYGTPECAKMAELIKEFPSAKREIHHPTRKARLSYGMMEIYIIKMPNADANLREFENVKLASRALHNPYKHVLDWFNSVFPHYNELIVKDANGEIIWDAAKLFKETAISAAEAAAENAAKILPIEQANTVELKGKKTA